MVFMLDVGGWVLVFVDVLVDEERLGVKGRLFVFGAPAFCSVLRNCFIQLGVAGAELPLITPDDDDASIFAAYLRTGLKAAAALVALVVVVVVVVVVESLPDEPTLFSISLLFFRFCR